MKRKTNVLTKAGVLLIAVFMVITAIPAAIAADTTTDSEEFSFSENDFQGNFHRSGYQPRLSQIASLESIGSFSSGGVGAQSTIRYHDNTIESHLGLTGTGDVAISEVIELTDAELAGFRDYDLIQVDVAIGSDTETYPGNDYDVWLVDALPTDPEDIYAYTTEIIGSGVSTVNTWHQVDVTDVPIPDTGSIFIGVNHYTLANEFPCGFDETTTTPDRGGIVTFQGYGAWDFLGPLGFPGVWGIDVIVSSGEGPGPVGDCLEDQCDFAIDGFTDEFEAMHADIDIDGDGETDYWAFNSEPHELCIDIANLGEIGIGEVKLLADVYEKVCGPTVTIFDDPKYDIMQFPCCGESYPFYFPDGDYIPIGDEPFEDPEDWWYVEDDGDMDSWALQGGPDNRWLTNNQAWRCTKGEDRSFGVDEDVYLGLADYVPANVYDNLTTPTFDVSGAACADVSFSHWCEGEYIIDDEGCVIPADYGTIAYSLDGGASWTEIGSGPQPWDLLPWHIDDTGQKFIAYDTGGEWQDVNIKFINTEIDANDLEYMHSYSMVCDDCQPDEGDIVVKTDLTGVTDLQVRFIWHKDPCLQYEGWYIDNLKVQKTLDYELELVCQTHAWPPLQMAPCDPEVGPQWIGSGPNGEFINNVDAGGKYCFPLECEFEDDTWYEVQIHAQVFDPVGCEENIENNEFKFQFKVMDIHDIRCVNMSFSDLDDWINYRTVVVDDDEPVSVPVTAWIQNIGTFAEPREKIDVKLMKGDIVVDQMVNDNFEVDSLGDYSIYYFNFDAGPTLIPWRWSKGDASIDNIYTSDPEQARSRNPGEECLVAAEEASYPQLFEDTLSVIVPDQAIDLDPNKNWVESGYEADCDDPCDGEWSFELKWSLEDGGSRFDIAVLPEEGPASGYIIWFSFGITGYSNDWVSIDFDYDDLVGLVEGGVLFNTWEDQCTGELMEYDYLPPCRIGLSIMADGPIIESWSTGIMPGTPNGGVTNPANPVPWTGVLIDNWYMALNGAGDTVEVASGTIAEDELLPGQYAKVDLAWNDVELCQHGLEVDVDLEGDINPGNDRCCLLRVMAHQEEYCFDNYIEDLTSGGECRWHVCTNREGGDDYFAWSGVETEHSAQYVNNMDEGLVSQEVDFTPIWDDLIANGEKIALNFTTWFEFWDSGDFGEVDIWKEYDHDGDPDTENITKWVQIGKVMGSSGGAFMEKSFVFDPADMENSRTKIRFRMVSDGSGVSEGWYVDDIYFMNVTELKSGSLAAWDMLFTFDVVTESGGPGNAGAEFDGTNFYSTRWASNLLHEYDSSGSLITQFSIPGVTGLRDLAYSEDTGYFYGGASASTIYEMDFSSQSLIGTITGSGWACRSIANNDDDDVLYTRANWNDPVYVIDRDTGATLSTFSTGIASVYGMAYDNDGSQKILYLFAQSGSGCEIYAYDLDSSVLLGLVADVGADLVVELGTFSGIAGGLFVDDNNFAPGKVVIGGLAQGDTGWDDTMFVYELRDSTGGGGSGNYVYLNELPVLTWMDDQNDIPNYPSSIVELPDYPYINLEGIGSDHPMWDTFERGDIAPWSCVPGTGGNWWMQSTDNATLPNEAEDIGHDPCDPCNEGWYTIPSENLVPYGYGATGTGINNAIAFVLDLTDPTLNQNYVEFCAAINYDLNKEKAYIEFSVDWEPGTPMESATWVTYWVHTPGDSYGDDTDGWVYLADATGFDDDPRWIIDEYIGNQVAVRFRLETEGNGAGIGEGFAVDDIHLKLKYTGEAFVDTVPPQTSIFFDAQTGQVNLNALDFPEGKASGVAATFYKLDGGEQQQGREFILPEGTHTIEYWSVDNNNNEETHKTATYTVDTTNPTVELTSPEAGIYFLGNKVLSMGSKAICIGKVPIAADASDGDGVGVQIVTFELSNGDSGFDTTAPYEYLFRGMHFGDLTIEAQATDLNGLKSSTDSMTIKVFSLGLL